MLKVNAALVGNIAFGFKGDVTGGYVETPGPIAARILKRLGVPDGRIGESLFDIDCDSVVGVYTAEAATGRELIGWLSASAPMAVLPDRMGVWQAIMLAPPAGPPGFTITGADILDLEADDGAPRGAGEFSVGWSRIWTTYRRETLQPQLLFTDAEARLGEAYRYANAADDDYKARYPAAWRKMKVDTALREEADAVALAATFKGLFGLRPDGKPRRQWRVTIELTDEALAIELGATVAVAAPEYGIDDLYLLIGEEPLRPRRDQTIWTVWG